MKVEISDNNIRIEFEDKAVPVGMLDEALQVILRYQKEKANFDTKVLDANESIRLASEKARAKLASPTTTTSWQIP